MHHPDEGLVVMTATARPCFHHTDPFAASTRTPLAPISGSVLELTLG